MATSNFGPTQANNTTAPPTSVQPGFVDPGIERSASNCALFSLNVAAANDNLAYPLGAASLLSTWNGATWSDDARGRWVCADHKGAA